MEFTFHQEKGYEQYGTVNSTWSFSIEEVEMSEDGGTYVLIEFIGLVTLNGNDFETSSVVVAAALAIITDPTSH